MATSDHFTAAEIARLCAAKGVKHAVISPGSRNAPLVIAFNDQSSITCLQVIDERSAGFFALGMAQQLGSPLALICTSGSAVLNYGPAIAEAFYQRIPLLVITADRPEEWVDQGEGQAIRQKDVLALHVRKSFQLPRAPADDLAKWRCGLTINEAIDATLLPVPGPVHMNVPFGEPLYGKTDAHPMVSRTIAQLATESFILPQLADTLVKTVSGTRKVMVLVGQGRWSDGLRKNLERLAELPQVVVLAEATSNLDSNAFITSIDRVIEGVNDANGSTLRPDLLITFGGAVISKRIKGLLRSWRPAQHWNIDPGQRHADTYQSLTHDIAVQPDMFLAQLMEHVRPCESRYKADWEALDLRTLGVHHSILAHAPWSDLALFSTLLDRIPERSDVHLANSTPARYAQLFQRGRRHRYWSNRGASGIDGCTSTAIGAAFATQRTTTLITGETAFCYDSNAFWNEHLSPHLRVIVIDNGGGNIFRFIDGPDHDPDLLRWFEAPHGRNPLVVARSYYLPCYEATDMPSLKAALDLLYQPHEKPAVLVVRTPAEVSPVVLRDYFKQLRS